MGLGLQLREMIVYYLVPWGTGGKSESVSSENSGMAAAVLSPGGVFVEKEKKTYIHMCVCVCVCFLPIHSGHEVCWTYQPGSHRRKVTQDF